MPVSKFQKRKKKTSVLGTSPGDWVPLPKQPKPGTPSPGKRPPIDGPIPLPKQPKPGAPSPGKKAPKKKGVVKPKTNIVRATTKKTLHKEGFGFPLDKKAHNVASSHARKNVTALEKKKGRKLTPAQRQKVASRTASRTAKRIIDRDKKKYGVGGLKKKGK